MQAGDDEKADKADKADRPARPRGAGPQSHPGRAQGREVALLALCHLESYKPAERAEALEIFWRHAPSETGDDGAELRGWLRDADVVAFARRLLTPALARAAEIDAAIEATSRSWRLARMDRVDRNLLRLVAVEMTDLSETPRAVIVAEAVRLASRYGSDRSAPFVNGVAEALAKRLRPGTR
jgi:N utilization substance protein B